MSPRLSRHTRLSGLQKFGAVLLIALVIGFNWLNLSTSRLLDRTTVTLGAAGEASTTVANVIREASFIELAATEFPERAEFDAAILHDALFLRQLEITRAAVAENGALKSLGPG